MKNYYFLSFLLVMFFQFGCVSQVHHADADHEHGHSNHDSNGMTHEGMQHDQASTPSEPHSQLEGHSGSHHHDAQFSNKDNAVSQLSENGLYQVTLFSNESPIPLQKIHSWSVKVENVKGVPVEKLKLFVFGGMPMHRHGFPTKPVVSDHLGNGEFRVDGIKFNMAGHWEMRFNLSEKGQPAGRGAKDRVVFNIHLK